MQNTPLLLNCKYIACIVLWNPKAYIILVSEVFFLYYLGKSWHEMICFCSECVHLCHADDVHFVVVCDLWCESKSVQFLLGYVYRGGCEILPCRAGPCIGSSTQPRHCLQRPEAWKVKYPPSPLRFSLYVCRVETTLSLSPSLAFTCPLYLIFY